MGSSYQEGEEGAEISPKRQSQLSIRACIAAKPQKDFGFVSSSTADSWARAHEMAINTEKLICEFYFHRSESHQGRTIDLVGVCLVIFGEIRHLHCSYLCLSILGPPCLFLYAFISP